MTCRQDGLFKLSNGEKVSCMLVENAVTLSSRWIQFALVVGAGEDFVAALVFPNFPNLERWARDRGRQLSTGNALSRDREIQALVAAEIGKSMSGFQPKYMRVKAFTIIPKELSIEDGEITPSMKVIRHHVVAKYRKWWDGIYRPGQDPDLQAGIVTL
jgi:long-chain acyl-CoA synthetase